MTPDGSACGRVAAPAGGNRWRRVAILAGGVAVLYLAGRWVSQDLIRNLGLLSQPPVMTATLVYIVLMAMPFMPAAEIGLGLLVVFGGEIAFLVYCCTVVALAAGYGMGRLLPAEILGKLFGVLGLCRAQRFVHRLAPLSGTERLAVLERETALGLARVAVRHRFVLLALLLNLPGNFLIGGGGGIALLAGMTRMFPFPAFLAAVALAVAPVPLIVFLVG